MQYVEAMDELSGKTAVITGAAGGIGLAMATRFAKAGMNIVLSDIEEPLLAQATEVVEVAATEAGHQIRTLSVVTDVGKGESVDELAAEAFAEFGQINLLCNNAGVSGSSIAGGTGGIDEAEWRWVLDVNLWGVVHGHRAFLPHMLDHGDGHIVNTASMAGHFPGNSAYSVSKWAVVAMSEGLFHELGDADSGVGISCLCPGWVKTRIAESERNRPEWAAPSAFDESAQETNEAMEFVKDAIASGLDPADVADMVHDAVTGDKFWIFPHPEMVEMMRGRYASILEGNNPAKPFSFD